MNLAALWNLRVLFCCENNLYAMGTALTRSESETDLCLKATAFEMPAWLNDDTTGALMLYLKDLKDLDDEIITPADFAVTGGQAVQEMAEEGVEVDYAYGTMIEIPRAALTADQVGQHADSHHVVGNFSRPLLGHRGGRAAPSPRLRLQPAPARRSRPDSAGRKRWPHKPLRERSREIARQFPPPSHPLFA